MKIKKYKPEKTYYKGDLIKYKGKTVKFVGYDFGTYPIAEDLETQEQIKL